MSDIYVVYSKNDRSFVEKLIEILERQWNVWWDDKIVGSYAPVIEREIPKAKCLLPVWSHHARESDSVRDELALAKRHGIPIVPVKVDSSEAPYGYISYSTADLSSWGGDADCPRLRTLLRKISQIVPPDKKIGRMHEIKKLKLPLPSVFISVSSHETQLEPLDALKVLKIFRSPHVLVSAYDMASNRLKKGTKGVLNGIRESGGLILLDSGRYEASRKDDKSWSQRDLASVLERVPHDLSFCFDVEKPSGNVERAITQVENAVKMDEQYTDKPVLPIVHAPPLKSGGYDLNKLIEIVAGVADHLNPPMIGVPERELGQGLIQRARTLRQIRQRLDDFPYYQPIHVLGTGNPWSLAVLLASGADSFDGLEWCRMVVDRETNRLNHFHHFDFFNYQAAMADSSVAVEAFNDENIDFTGKTAFHNLDYYKELAEKLRKALIKNDFEALITGLLGNGNTKELQRQFPEILQ